MTLIVVVGTMVAILLLTWLASYNGLVHLRQDIRHAWSDLDQQLKQRYQLISTFTQILQSGSGHAESQLTAVIAARNQTAVAADLVELAAAESELTLAFTILIDAVQNDDLLKSDPHVGLTSKTAFANKRVIDRACGRYNRAVYAFNASLRSFPQIMTAKVMGLHRQPFFELPA